MVKECILVNGSVAFILHCPYTVLQPELSDAEGNLGSMAKSSSFW